jgi:hypothetical protein
MTANRVSRIKLWGILLIGLLTLQLTAWQITPVSAAGSSDYSFSHGAFRQAWEKYDLPVVSQRTSRSLVWGAQGFAFLDEPYQESLDHARLVQYFDKGRMEITFVNADHTSPYYVTNGLLVRDMVAGIVQEGNNQFTKLVPSTISVAGDLINIGPTYNSFRQVASLSQNNQAPKRTGAVVKETINREGRISESESLALTYQVKYVAFDDVLDHNIPDVFWSYMLQSGITYQNGRFVGVNVLFDRIALFGLPLTEAYWSKVIVGGAEQDVLIQLFERRVLTYTPNNPANFKVEMGNVGRHYYSWRYPGQAYTAPWAEVQLINKSDCNSIEVALTGQDYLTIAIPAYSTVTHKFGPGNYSYVASGCSAIPKRDSFTLRPNQNYDLPFSIRKEII